jgi:hypothetical protein
MYIYIASKGDRRVRDRMVTECTTTCAISAYQHKSCEFESRSWRGVLDIKLCDQVFQSLAIVRWFSLRTLVFPTNETDPHTIPEILWKVALNTIAHC